MGFFKVVLFVATLVAATAASAQLMMNFGKKDAMGAGPPPTCTADGLTDWSNACDIPMGVALGIM